MASETSANGYVMSMKGVTLPDSTSSRRGAELPQIRFHDLCHTCATILLMAGKHPEYVQDLLGHARICITLDTYSPVIEGIDDALRTRVSEAVAAIGVFGSTPKTRIPHT
jgi:site-specific recombinase XerD